MVDCNLLLSFGQSNEQPNGQLSTWFTDHIELNLPIVTRRSLGAKSNRFVMPGNFPGFAELDLQGVAYRTLHYLTFYNPCSTGYKSYPCVGRLTPGASQTAAELFVEQTFVAGTHPLTIVRQRTGTSHTVTAISNAGLPAGAGSKLTIDGATPWTAPVENEQFDYAFKVTAGTGTAVLTINLTFGLGFGGSPLNGSLLGLTLNCVTGANAGRFRVIHAWNNATRQVTIASAFPDAIAAGDTFTITPQQGAFEDFGFWLPLCPFEAGDVAGRVNQYPPGFNWANQFCVPQVYKYDATTGQGLMPKLAAYHMGLAAKLQQHLGGDMFVLTAGVGGTSLAHNQLAIAVGDVGWFDPHQERCWAPSEPSNCFRRMIRQLQAGLVAFEMQRPGDALRVAATVFPHGETDGNTEAASAAYGDNLRQMRSELRAELKGLGLWPRSAELIPFVQPKILLPTEGGAWPYAAVINGHIEVTADEDRAAGTCEVSDVPHAIAHYTSYPLLEQRVAAEILRIRRDTDPAGEIRICNQALKLIGDAGRITSIDPPDEGSAQAAACADHFQRVRNALYQEHAWGFATRRRKLTPVESTTTVWPFAYLRPGDVSHILAVQPPDAVSDNTFPSSHAAFYPRPALGGIRVPLKHSDEKDELGRRVIYTVQENAVLKYVQLITDTRLWSASFEEAMIYKLAAELALSLVKGSSGRAMAKDFRLAAELAKGKAETADSDESEDPPEHDASWIEGMH